MPNKELTRAAAETLEDRAVQVEVTLPVRPRRQESAKGGQPDGVSTAESPPRIPRITRLMALAIKFQAMIDCGDVRDYADLARLGYVTRARLTQIMNLLNLAPDIQDEILSAYPPPDGDALPVERHLRAISQIVLWSNQRPEWMILKKPN